MKKLLCSLILVSYMVGCSSESEMVDAPASDSAASEAVAMDPIANVGDVVEVQMTADDRMRYNLESFSAKVGQTVKLTLVNIGKMPKAAMGHNVVFLKPGSDQNAYVSAAAQRRDSEYIPESEATFAHTKLLGPGESDTIQFKVTEAGDYTFLCSFPAHLYAGMRGIMTVVE
jgi:azurin